MKILVVDDSIVFRSSITKALEGVPEIEMIKSAPNGKVAIQRLQQENYDLMTLDIEMPELDGLATIQEVRKFNSDIKIIVFSSQTLRAADKTITALSGGANDFVSKGAGGNGSIEESIQGIRDDLLPKIMQFKDSWIKENKHKLVGIAGKKLEKSLLITMPPKIICMASSTGGPDALRRIFSKIDRPISIPIVLVQHMPPLFTAQLAVMLDKVSAINFSEGKIGDVLKPNHCYIAPGDYHMTLKKKEENHVISLDQTEKVCSVRPAANNLFQTVSEIFKDRVCSVVLTGMGEDGMEGAISLSKHGVKTYVQDQESSIVWGMPGAVEKSEETISEVIDIDNIPNLIMKMGNSI